MPEYKQRDWLDIIQDEFEHPAIVLWRAAELKYIEEALNKHNLGNLVLDLGCAEGKIASLLFKRRSLVGLDNTWQLLKQNKKMDSYKALILADGCRMPYKDAVFSGVFSNCVMEHIPDIDGVLSEGSRVLKNSGIFLFTVPSHKFGDYLFFSTIFQKIGLRSFACFYKSMRNKMLNHFHCYDHNKWKNLLEKKGLKLIEWKYYMTKKATFVWDFLAVFIFIVKSLPILKYLMPKTSKSLNNFMRKYYAMNEDTGSGLLLVAQKGA